ncbi:shTK domain protein [Ancylostoma caninum]|uniref:Metalloendopeptidase n=1 Tax=Ancylostoma caninum TaxID=29170 RepID=A0A368HDK8_ANCCA|nr:shTK domain protein [Ancylostoma caninum]
MPFQKTRRKGARRNGVITGIKKWPNGRIPYMISGQYTERERALLARSFQEYHKRTCIRFVPRTPLDRDYLYIGKIDGCFSDVGRAGGRQELSLDDGCMQYDTAIHELMHSVGFYHEHERWDRDNHIRILWQNIDRDAYDQFGKVDLSESSYYGQVYDYYSIMHYDSLAFSKNGLETMVARRPEMTVVIGSAIDFSPTDVLKMNLMYQCGENVIPDVVEKIVPPLPLSPPVPAVPIQGPPVVEDDDCVDKTNLCWRWLDRCGSFFFEKIMKEFCALSCGYCIPKSKVAAPVKAAKGASASYLQLG